MATDAARMVTRVMSISGSQIRLNMASVPAMRRRIACAAATVTLISSASLLLLLGSTNSAIAESSRHCRPLKERRIGYRVTIERGPVTCRRARRVLGVFLSGGGKQHGNGSTATTYWTLLGWTCARGAGGGGCFRGGSSYRNARDLIGAEEILPVSSAR